MSADFSPTHIRRFINRYFKYWSFFAANDMSERITHIVLTADKKRDISWYLNRLGRYLSRVGWYL